jgi:hypothetical protein
LLLIFEQWAGQDPDILYQLKLRQRDLACLYLQWQAKVRGISSEGQDFWGPAGQDIMDATVICASNNSDSHSGPKISGGSNTGHDSDDCSWDSADGSNSDDGLIEELENVAFTDAYAYSDTSDVDSA